MIRCGAWIAAVALAIGAVPATSRDRGGTALDWRKVATPNDRNRIRNWRSTWLEALARADRADRAKVRAEGALLVPDAASGDPTPPPGDYRCRTIKLGAQGEGMADFVTYPPYQCRIGLEGDVLSFAKLSGSQRPAGLLFPDSSTRMVFLGSMMLGSERRAHDYGTDGERDMAGLVERIGPRRWRLVLPRPRWESMLDVIELIPIR